MENFLDDYISMLAETTNIEIDENQQKEIIENIANNDELWDIFDGYIYELLKKFEK